MPRLKYRSGGAWVDSALSGAVTFGGERIAFGPPTGGGTIDEFFTFPNPLSSLDWPDTGANVATRFAVAEAGSWIGIRVWRAITSQDGEYVFACNGDAGTILTPNTPIASETRGAFISQEFAVPTPVVPGVNYVAAYHTNLYGFSRVTDGAVTPFTTERMFTDSAMGATAFYTYTPNTVPTSASPNFHFNISPIVRFPA